MEKPEGITLASWILQLMRDGKLYAFYKSRAWRNLRDKVLSDAHWECADCKAKGAYTKAVMVHHDMEVRQHPGLALSEWYTDEQGRRRRNLWPLCFDCHERRHDRMFSGHDNGASERAREMEERFPERWD